MISKTFSNNEFSILLWFILITTCNKIVESALFFDEWKLGNSTLPFADRGMAAGYYNQSIFLIGGEQHRFQLTQYNIVHNTMTDYGNISVDTFGVGQFYTTVKNIIYMIDWNGDKFSTFNLKTKVFTNDWNGIRIPLQVWFDSCLASTEQFLFIVGGQNSKELQIFNLSNNQWLPLSHVMLTIRTRLACIVHPLTNELYAIGGTDNQGTPVNTIEKVYIENIENNSWESVNNLLIPAEDPRAIIFSTNILIIGGYNNINSQFSDQ
eukprot:260459_1